MAVRSVSAPQLPRRIDARGADVSYSERRAIWRRRQHQSCKALMARELTIRNKIRRSWLIHKYGETKLREERVDAAIAE
jgi:hypothetical protein